MSDNSCRPHQPFKQLWYWLIPDGSEILLHHAEENLQNCYQIKAQTLKVVKESSKSHSNHWVLPCRRSWQNSKYNSDLILPVAPIFKVFRNVRSDPLSLHCMPLYKGRVWLRWSWTNGVIHRPEVEASRELPSCRTSLALAFPLTPIHFGVTLTAYNFTSEAFEDPICPLFISKETRQCIKCSITL